MTRRSPIDSQRPFAVALVCRLYKISPLLPIATTLESEWAGARVSRVFGPFLSIQRVQANRKAFLGIGWGLNAGKFSG